MVQASIGLAVPGRPIRSLVAEDRSAGGVRDHTGPEAVRAARHLDHADNQGHKQRMNPEAGQALRR